MTNRRNPGHGDELQVNDGNQYLAEMMRVSARAYAAHAATQLLARHPDCGEPFGANAFRDWQASLAQRLDELAVAVELDEPLLFQAQVEWTRDAFTARAVPVEYIGHSLEALRTTLVNDLPDGSGDVVLPYIESGLAVLDGSMPVASGLGDSAPEERTASRYVATAVAGDQRGAARLVLDAVRNGLSTRDAFEKVLLPAEVEIGRLWHTGEIGVAEEHAATGTTCALMSILTWNEQAPPGDARLVMLAAVEGDRHDVGARAAAGLLEMGGCRSVLLGADVPTGEIIRAVRESGPHAVLLSATLTVHLPAMRRVIRGLRDIDGPVRVLVGGPALDRAPHLAQRLEADTYVATLGDAVTAVNGQTGGH